MVYEIFKSLPHQKITISPNQQTETFDIYQCGFFQYHLHEENIELVELPSKKRYTPHYHKLSTAIIYVIMGEGIFNLGDKYMEYFPGLRIVIPSNTLHAFQTHSTTLFLSFQSPAIITDNGEIDIHYEVANA